MRETNATEYELLECFFSECERKFRFLEQKHGFGYVGGLAEYKNAYKIIKPYHGQTISGPFLAMIRYEKDNLAFEIVYGGREMSLEFHSCYGPVHRFTPVEILLAARRTAASFPEKRGIVQGKTIEDSLAKCSRTLEKNSKILLAPPPRLLERAYAIRRKRLEQSIRKHYRQTLEHAGRQAAKAYREKDFAKVVRILEPHRKALCKSDLKKLYLAKSRLRE